MDERVQVQGLGEAPTVQPVDLPGYQYGIGQRRAGRNKLMDLADALSQVNPILQQYGNIRRVEQERQKAEAEALEKEGYRAYQTSPATMAKTLAKIRAATERGEIPDEANVPRIMGALKAKSEVLVNRDYRNILMNPALLESATDPIVEAARQREEFLKRTEFESPSVRDHAFKYLEKVENEFIGKVQNRLDAFEVEEGKQNWLLTGKDSVNQVINGELDVNDPIIKNWINNPAGLFKGSRKYAWDNLMKEELKEGLTSGRISPTKAVKFLDNLRELDLGGGVKFADAETGNSISDFYDVIENQRGVLENKAAQKANLEFDLLNNGLVDSLLESLGEGNNVSSVDARNIRESYLSSLPKAISKEKAIDTFDKILGNVNKPGNDATKLITGKLDTLIEEGFELDAAVAEVQSTFESGGITVTDRNRLLKKIEDSRDFDRLIYKADFYRNIITVDEELITGFVKERAAFGPATYEVGYFTELGADNEGENGVYDSIVGKKTTFAAKSFVNRRYNAYELALRKAFESKFKRYESDPAFTPEQAQEKIIEESQEIRDRVFKQWEQESIILANSIYDLNIPEQQEKFISPGVMQKLK
jgi:hypothetical protein